MQHSTGYQEFRDDVSEKKRFESFMLRNESDSSNSSPKRADGRSHSRKASISISKSTSMDTSKPTNPFETIPGKIPSLPPQRNSHHRRHSSVSTRIESAEMMGVSVPDLPPSISDDNLNLGEKDSIRRRALLALEGKPDLSFSKVEIPELTTPIMEKLMFDFTASASSNTPSCFNSPTTKRESYKLRPASSTSKDQLHTLMEEDEEEHDVRKEVHTTGCALKKHEETSSIQSLVSDSESSDASLRYTFLDTSQLRPLSLTPDTLSTGVFGSPPDPVSNARSGLKALTLPSSIVGEEQTIIIGGGDAQACGVGRQHGNFEGKSTSRRSSISYKSSALRTPPGGLTRNMVGIPAAVKTPTSIQRHFPDAPHRLSSERKELGFFGHPAQSRPLSASEQHFFFKSHDALLARITDLEHALSMRRRSSGGYSNYGSPRPVSSTSDTSSNGDEPRTPGEEILRLVADLKAERDDLKSDIDGWRTRVANMEKQLSTLFERVERDRRDAWLARSTAGLLEVEKKTLERKLEQTDKVIQMMALEKSALMKDNDQILQTVIFLKGELAKTQQGVLEDKCTICAAQSLALPYTGSNDTTMKSFPGFVKDVSSLRSTDSESSITDVEDFLEVAEDGSESDGSFRSSTSLDNSPRSSADIDAPSLSMSTTHNTSGNSLSKAWRFPFGAQIGTGRQTAENEVDRFFECLQDDSFNGFNTQFDFNDSKYIFSSGLQTVSESDVQFFAPLGNIEDVPPMAMNSLEENDDDENVFGEAGGIQITFTPPQDRDGQVSSSMIVPASSQKISATVSEFHRSECIELSNSPLTSCSPLRFKSLPSAIPRPKNLETHHMSPSFSPSQVSKGHAVSSINSVVTRIGKFPKEMPSMIPQLVSSSIRAVSAS